MTRRTGQEHLAVDESVTTLGNWQEPAHSQWGFAHVSELIATMEIPRSTAVFEMVNRDTLDPDDVVFEFDNRAGSLTSVIDASRVDALIVVHDGSVRFEHYGREMSPDRTHILMSVSKSITSSLAAVLTDEGHLGVNQRVEEFVPELIGTSLEGATVQQLLDFRVGVEFNEDYADADADVRIYEQIAGHRPRTRTELPDSLYEYMPRLAPRAPHGGAFKYQSIATDVLAWVLERATGAPFASLVSSRLWSPLGAQFDAQVTMDAGGAPFADGGICATLRDVARFGLAHLEHGELARREVVPSEWIRACLARDPELVAAFRSGAPDSSKDFIMYHNNWWILDSERGIFAGLGIYGQLLYIDRSRDLVIVQFSSWPTALDQRLHDEQFAMVDAVSRYLEMNRS